MGTCTGVGGCSTPSVTGICKGVGGCSSPSAMGLWAGVGGCNTLSVMGMHGRLRGGEEGEEVLVDVGLARCEGARRAARTVIALVLEGDAGGGGHRARRVTGVCVQHGRATGGLHGLLGGASDLVAAVAAAAAAVVA
eukprot:1160843-Pelagomonas_calceolata.AAC.8